MEKIDKDFRFIAISEVFMIFNAYSDTSEGLFDIYVKSSGHVFAKNGRSISRPYGRDDWLLFYVSRGSERFFLDGAAYDAGEGDFIFFRPREPQEHVCLSEKTAEFYYVHFCAPEDFDLFGFETSRIYSSKPSSTVKDIFENIISELQSKKQGYGKICASKLFSIIAELSRREAKESDPNRAYADRIAFVIQIMNREYAENHTLEDYAAMCKMSKFHFLRIFKEITGTSPVEYKNNIRMEHALEFLEDGTTPVGEIAAQVGFSSAAYFCDAFKKKYGISPTAYKKRRSY